MTTDAHSSTATNDDWLKAQMQFWENWSRMCTQGLTDAGGMPKGSWAETLDQWWSVAAKNVPEHREFYQRMVEQGKTFMAIGQEIANFLTGVQSCAQAGDGWKNQLKSHFDSVKEAFAKTQSGDIPAYLRGFTSVCELPLDTLRRTLSGTATVPGDFLQNLRSDALGKFGDHVHEGVDKFLSVPGVGYTREGQEQLQTFARTLLNYQKALQEYLSAHNHLGMETLDRLYKKLVTMGDKGESIQSLRAIYDLCVDCGEEAYAEFAMSEEYQRVYGEVVNALMAVKHQTRTMVDESLGTMNMPTRHEMNGIVKRQQELKRIIKSIQRNLNDGGGSPRGRKRGNGGEDSTDIGVLQREVAALRQEMTAARAAAEREDMAAAADPKLPVKPMPKNKTAGKKVIRAVDAAGDATEMGTPSSVSRRPTSAGR
jgi:class III poly(R)-hydroxyalkanoic acid synthase PhaE subunit